MPAGLARRPSIGMATARRRSRRWVGIRQTQAERSTLSMSRWEGAMPRRRQTRSASSGCTATSMNGAGMSMKQTRTRATVAVRCALFPISARSEARVPSTAWSAAGRGTSPPSGAGRPSATGTGPLSASASRDSVFVWSAVRQPKKNQQAAEPPGGTGERRGSRRRQTRPAEQGRRQTEPASPERGNTFGRRIFLWRRAKAPPLGRCSWPPPGAARRRPSRRSPILPG